MEVSLVFPHQLFDPHPALKPGRRVLLIEDSLFFGDPHHPARFHRQKLIFHRASMKAWAAARQLEGYQITYVEHRTGETNTIKSKADRVIGTVLQNLEIKQGDHLFFADPTDDVLGRRLRRFAEESGAVLHALENPSFLTPRAWNTEYYANRKERFMARYYQAQRRRLGLMLDADGQPQGGQWSFDEDNRKPWPKKQSPPAEPPTMDNPFIREAVQHVSGHYSDNPGRIDGFWYHIDRAGALKWLDEFLQQRFPLFGDYEDAISARGTVLYHSVLTPYLNTGLLTPQEVVQRAVSFANDHGIPLNSLEGFVRQVIGWREFMRAMYEQHGIEQRNANYWKFDRPMPAAFYDGTTGIAPVDTTIRRVLDHAYCHHIERLMVLGNFMLLCGIRPDDIYKWFMELFIDAYDWVMVPNVYGMSQFADGGIFTTKPYLSGSNYIRKMSDYSPGPWCAVWDGLFWSFIDREQKFFRAHPRLGMMTRQLDKLGPKLIEHRRQADEFLDSLK